MHFLVQSSFDLLLIDLKLPGMDGVAIARYAQKSHPSAAILFITGSSDFKGATVTVLLIVSVCRFCARRAQKRYTKRRISTAAHDHFRAPRNLCH